MCVILVGDARARPTLKTLRACAAANRDGIGFAVRENGRVLWRKGISLTALHRAIRAARGDWVAHFRLATVGSPSDELCHPFPISRATSLALHGVGAESVLFHNGHLMRWQEELVEAAAKHGEGPPPGAFSDSRAAAWLAAMDGDHVLGRWGSKFALLSPAGVRLFPSTGWERLADGVRYSNTNWRASWDRDLSGWWRADTSMRPTPPSSRATVSTAVGSSASVGTRTATRKPGRREPRLGLRLALGPARPTCESCEGASGESAAVEWAGRQLCRQCVREVS